MLKKAVILLFLAMLGMLLFASSCALAENNASDEMSLNEMYIAFLEEAVYGANSRDVSLTEPDDSVPIDLLSVLNSVPDKYLPENQNSLYEYAYVLRYGIEDGLVSKQQAIFLMKYAIEKQVFASNDSVTL